MKGTWWVAGIAVAALLGGVVVRACDAPVYLYALQNWERDPYQAYYFYADSEAEEDRAANELLDQMAAGEVGHANIQFARVKVDGSADLRVEIWKHHGGGKLPLHIVMTPNGRPLFVGRLTVTKVRELTDSPKRREISETLCKGLRGIVLLLTSGDKAADAKARDTCQQVVAEAKEQGTAVGYVELARDDAREQLLVKQFLLMEDDLEKTEAPIVYGIFGRGHVLEPFVGAGITPENVRQIIAFMNGPCTCTVKAASPGMDLLTSFDWQAKVAGMPPAQERPERSFLMGAADEAGYVEFDVGDQPEGREPQPEDRGGVESSPPQEADVAAGGPAVTKATVAEPHAVAAEPERAEPAAVAKKEAVALPTDKLTRAPEKPKASPPARASRKAGGRASSEVGGQRASEALGEPAEASAAKREAVMQPAAMEMTEAASAPAESEGPRAGRVLALFGLSLALAAIVALVAGTAILLQRGRQ